VCDCSDYNNASANAQRQPHDVAALQGPRRGPHFARRMDLAYGCHARAEQPARGEVDELAGSRSRLRVKRLYQPGDDHVLENHRVGPDVDLSS